MNTSKLPAWIHETPTSMGFWTPKELCLLCGGKRDVLPFFYYVEERAICKACAKTHCGMDKRWEYAGGGSITTLEKKA